MGRGIDKPLFILTTSAGVTSVCVAEFFAENGFKDAKWVHLENFSGGDDNNYQYFGVGYSSADARRIGQALIAAAEEIEANGI